MDDYVIYEPPFEKRPDEMSTREAKLYFEWFMEQMPRRIKLLEGAVQDSPRHVDWQANYLEGSLVGLGQWFAGAVRMRSLTSEERQDYLSDSPKWRSIIQPPDSVLDLQSLSYAVDVGIYFGECLRHARPHLYWERAGGGKRYMYYNRPALGGFARGSHFEPTNIGTVLAIGLARRKYGPEELRSTWHVWLGMADTSGAS